MQIPETPPDFQSILKHAMANEPVFKKILMSGPSDHKGRYLHWDELRRKETSNGLTHEQMWAGMKFDRLKLAKPLPFVDKNDETFRYGEPDCIRRKLRWLDMNCGGNITTAREMGNERDAVLYLTRSLLEEPISSSILEGAATTRVKARQMIEQQRAPRDIGEQMVLNNYKAMQEIAELKDQPLTPELVLHIHKRITKDTLDDPAKSGVYRDESDQVDVVDMSGIILHHPPEAGQLEQRMQALCDFANGSEDDEPYVHPISRAIMLHFMLAYDHPFVDGNGRVARALFYWSVLRSGYWMMEYVSISHIIARAPAKYGMAFLKVETDEQDITYFLDHQLEVTKRAFEELHLCLERERKKTIAFGSLLPAKFNARQITLLKDLDKKTMPHAVIGKHQKRFGISYLTARSDLEGLLHTGLLKKTKVGRQSIYQIESDIAKRLEKRGNR